MNLNRLLLLRLEAAMAPDRIPLPEPAVQVVRTVNGKRQEHWRSGFVTALDEATCNGEARKSALSLANIPKSLVRVPWC